MRKQYPTYVKATILLLFVVLLFYGLIMARDFLYPVAIGILFSGLLYPLVLFFERLKFPKALAILVSILIGIAVVGGVAYLLFKQLSVFFENFDQIKSEATENFRSVRESVQGFLGIKVKDNEQWPINNMSRAFGEVFSATTGTIVKIGLQPVYVFFFLYYREKFYRFLYKMTPERKHQTLREIINDYGVIAKNYIGGLFIVVLILCVINSTGLYIIGLKYAVLFGILSAICNFIPYFGTLIGGSFPLLYALLLDPAKALYVILLFACVQFLENNILTPRITGGHVNINPIITILGIIVGGMVWGLPGMFLSVPALAMLKSVCGQINSLKPVAYLLERNSNHTEETSPEN